MVVVMVIVGYPGLGYISLYSVCLHAVSSLCNGELTELVNS